MKELPTIILVRHGQTQWNLEGRYQGQLNSDLTEKGKAQSRKNASKIAKVLDLKMPFKVFSSPLGRAKESSYLICDELGFDKSRVIFDERLSEFNYGIFEGKTKDECRELYPQVLAQREANKWLYEIENGESYLLVKERLLSWLKSVSDEKIVVVVAHEMVNRTLRGIYCNLATSDILELRQSNDLVIKLENYKEKKLE
jgi:probable phosphoglycerate mutase